MPEILGRKWRNTTTPSAATYYRQSSKAFPWESRYTLEFTTASPILRAQWGSSCLFNLSSPHSFPSRYSHP